MEKQAFKNSSPPLEPALQAMILNKSAKIRRPPNAFMLFARDHRRLIAVQHPSVCNKTVSTMLGKVWRSTPDTVKSKYYKKAKTLSQLHKRLYPNYVYSPREARIQKMNKKKRNKEETLYVDALQQKREPRTTDTTKSMDEDNLNEEGCTSAEVPDPQSGPVYVPNNPGFFSHPTSDIHSDDERDYDERPHPCADFQRQSEPLHEGWNHDDEDRGWQPSPGICRCCERSKLGCHERHIPPYHRPENERTNLRHPDLCSFAPPSTFCNSSGHFSQPMSPYCYSPPPRTSPGLRPYIPPFHPYWNLPAMNCPSRERIYENLKPYPTPYYTPDCFGHPFGYFDGHAAQFSRNPRQPFNEREGVCEREQHISQNSESLSGFSRYVDKGNSYCHSQVRNSTLEDEMAPHKERIAKRDIGNYEDVRNQSQDRMRESLNTGPVTEDGMCLKEDQGGRLLLKEKNENCFSREKCQPSVADEAIFADFRNFRAQVRSQESSSHVEFSGSGSDQNKFRTQVRFEEALRLPESSESNCDRNSFKNKHDEDISPELSDVSNFCDSSKMFSWNTPAIESCLPHNIPPKQCDVSLTLMDDRSISGSFQNNIFTPNKLSADSMNAEARSNYNGHCQNKLENTACNNTTRMQYEETDQTTEVYSDSRNYPSQINQQIFKKESMPNFPVSFIKIEENSDDVFEEYTENNSKTPNKACNTENIDKKIIEKTTFFPSTRIRDGRSPIESGSNNSNIGFEEYQNSRTHQIPSIIFQVDKSDKEEKMDDPLLKDNSQFEKRPVLDHPNTTSTLKASYNASYDSNRTSQQMI